MGNTGELAYRLLWFGGNFQRADFWVARLIHVATTWVLEPNQGVVAQSELKKDLWEGGQVQWQVARGCKKQEHSCNCPYGGK